MIRRKRAYEPAHKNDGTRVLVDRVWPRGVKKEKLVVDKWAKEVAPSTELRKWFRHDPKKWNEFRARYLKELRQGPARAELEILEKIARKGDLTLIYGARDEEHNQAVVLEEYLKQMTKKVPSTRKANRDRAEIKGIGRRR